MRDQQRERKGGTPSWPSVPIKCAQMCMSTGLGYVPRHDRVHWQVSRIEYTGRCQVGDHLCFQLSAGLKAVLQCTESAERYAAGMPAKATVSNRGSDWLVLCEQHKGRLDLVREVWLQGTGSLNPALGPCNMLTRCQQMVLQLRGQGSARDRTTPLHSGNPVYKDSLSYG